MSAMRIVQLLTQERGGPVDHAVDVACELARRGHESHIVGPVAAVAERLTEAGVVRHEIAITNKGDLRGAAAVARRVVAISPDVLHCQDRRGGLLGRIVGSTLRGTGLIYTLHGVADGLSDLVAGNVRAAPRRRRDTWYYLTGERWTSRVSGCRVVVPSAAVARFAVEHVRLPPSIVDIVPNGVDVRRFIPASKPGPPVTALWLGVMGAVKRLDVLVAALRQVPEMHLRLVGSGPERAAVERAAAAADLSGRITVHDPVADPAPLFDKVHLFILPSAAENCPLALLQAMAAGLPVVATRVGGIPEVVRDGVDGLLVPPGDPHALATSLQSLLADPSALRRMGASARERVTSQYTLHTCVEGLLRSYSKALACAR